MSQTLQAKEVTLAQLEENFGLVQAPTGKLFADGTVILPELSESDRSMLTEAKAEFRHLSMQDVLEPIVKMVVLSPLLRMKAALPQVLTYMLASPSDQGSVTGLVTNGSEFRFVQLTKGEQPSYLLSDLLAIDRGDDLDRVAQILKYLGRNL